jgi:hypothetical protein
MDDSGIGSIRMSQQQDQETADKVFAELLKDPENTRCCDCKTKGKIWLFTNRQLFQTFNCCVFQLGAKWASHSIGAFLCIRCSGIHSKFRSFVVVYRA